MNTCCQLSILSVRVIGGGEEAIDGCVCESRQTLVARQWDTCGWRPTSTETDRHNVFRHRLLHQTSMLFSILRVTVWHPDIYLYNRYIDYRISFNITSCSIVTESVSPAIFKVMGLEHLSHELDLARSHDIFDNMTIRFVIYHFLLVPHGNQAPPPFRPGKPAVL